MTDDVQRPVLMEANIETIAMGRVVEQVNARIAEGLAHCLEHTNLDKPRTITLKIAIKPSLDEGEVAAAIATKVDVSWPGQKGPVDRAVLRNGSFQVLNVPGTAESQTDITDFTTVKQQRSEG